MIQNELYQKAEKNQAHFTNPPVVLKQNKQAPLLSHTGVVIARNLIKRLGIAETIDENLALLQRHKPYSESDHVLNMVYNFLTGGEKLLDIERLQEEKSFLRVLGAESVPDPTTAGDFLVRFSDDDIDTLQASLDQAQDDALFLLEKDKKGRATIDSDSSIYEVYGKKKKEGADYSYNKKWSYNGLHLTLAETGDIVYQELREGSRYSSDGLKELLPGTIERLQKHFRKVRYRADSAFYDKGIVNICDERGVEFFIVADQTGRILTEVVDIEEDAWKPFNNRKNKLNKGGKKAKKRKKRKNHKRAVGLRGNPDMKFKGKAEIASFVYQPVGWEKAYRFVVKRTEIVDKDNQLYLEDGLCKYVYYIVVTNSNKSDSAVMRIAQGRANQENLIKDFKDGLGLSHVPTGFFNANKVYFKIAALAWNIKTWMLNLLKIGDGSALRFKRFLYKWIYQAGIVSITGRNTVVIRIPEGGYFHRFQRALNRMDVL
ncbi:MAG: IS1380 family transposase [Fidelibacterota bacterium]